jgi:hypothetical protein
MEAKKEKRSNIVHSLESVWRPLVPYLPAKLAAMEREKKRKYEESLPKLRDPWDSNIYDGSSCYMSCSNEHSSVNLLASQDESKNNKEKKRGSNGRMQGSQS